MSYVVDRGLLKLRDQVDAAAPGRKKGSDGTIGDAEHAARTSQHNPESPPPPGNPDNQVDALDLTHDPASGADMAVVTEAIRRSKDLRVRYCVTPESRVLTSSLAWVPIGEIAPGQELVAFDEFGPRGGRGAKATSGQRMRTAQVLATSRLTLPCYRITTDRGVVTASGDHLWLVARQYRQTYRRWVRTEDLKPGMPIQHFSDPWEPADTFDEGWLGGLLDGEGCLSRAAHFPSGWRLTISQKPGPVMDEIERILSSMKFAFSRRVNPGADSVYLRGGLPEVLRLLGSVRTQRLFRKAVAGPIWEDHKIDGRWPHATVHKIEPVGDREVVAVETTTSTLLVEGMFSHNCIFARRIFSSYASNGRQAWVWGPYDGSDPHAGHAHISVNDQHHDETQDWKIGIDGVQLTDLLSDRKTTVNNALMTMLARTDYLANRLGLDARLTEVLTAVEDDVATPPGPTEIVLSMEQLNTIIAAVAAQVTDQVIARMDALRFEVRK
jgi:hypothetical protein